MKWIRFSERFPLDDEMLVVGPDSYGRVTYHILVADPGGHVGGEAADTANGLRDELSWNLFPDYPGGYFTWASIPERPPILDAEEQRTLHATESPAGPQRHN